MTRIALVIGIATLASPVNSAQLEDACLARGTWNEETCTCMQGVADKSLPLDKQELAAAFFARQITSQQIAEQFGVAVAQDFLHNLSVFMNESTSECGAP